MPANVGLARTCAAMESLAEVSDLSSRSGRAPLRPAYVEMKLSHTMRLASAPAVCPPMPSASTATSRVLLAVGGTSAPPAARSLGGQNALESSW